MDFLAGATLNFKFTTAVNGVPTALLGTPDVKIYKTNSTTESSSGVSLTVNFDSLTGLNNVFIDTSSDGTFYSAGGMFQIVITAGTVGGNSVVGTVVGEFNLQKETVANVKTTVDTNLNATVSSRLASADYTAPDNAGISTINSNVSSVKSTVDTNLNTTVSSRLAASAYTAPDNATIGTINTNVSSIKSTVDTNLNATVSSRLASASYTAPDNADIASIKSTVDANLDAKVSTRLPTSSYTAPDNAGIAAIESDVISIKSTVDTNLNATVSSRLAASAYTAPLDASGTRSAIGLSSANLDTQLGAINSKTTNLPADPAAASDIPTSTENADTLLNRDMSVVSDTNSRTPLNALRFLRNKWSIYGTLLTVTKEDDSAPAWTANVSTQKNADPVVGSDPT